MKDQLVIKGILKALPEFDEEDVIEVVPCKEKKKSNQSIQIKEN